MSTTRMFAEMLSERGRTAASPFIVTEGELPFSDEDLLLVGLQALIEGIDRLAAATERQNELLRQQNSILVRAHNLPPGVLNI